MKRVERMNIQSQQISREDIAKREVGETAISVRCARFLVAIFLLTIFIVPVVQHLQEGVLHRKLPQCYDILHSVRIAVDRGTKTEGSPYHRVLAANRVMLREMALYEEALEEQSWLTGRLLPASQQVLTSVFGVGNEMAYLGHGSWLFYRPDVDYVTSPGFLNPEQLQRRTYDHQEWGSRIQPNPLTAIQQFAEQLVRRDIQLLVMPIPVKPVILPDRFAKVDGPVQNPSYDRFIEQLEEIGVPVFDPSAILIDEAQSSESSPYLQTDTHWTPAVVDRIASALADDLRRRMDLSPSGSSFTRGHESVEELGDIAVMLQLPGSQRRYPKERVEIRPVFGPSGELWVPSRAADILFLGDSFANIYSLPSMGWGASAGLVEQLSYHLQRPVDRIVRNDEGAFATRRILDRELARGRDRLAGKKRVIWEFAMRELAFGDWQMLPMELAPPQTTEFIVPEPGERLEIAGVIQEASPVPRPGSVPYKDHVMALHLVDVALPGETLGDRQALVYLWSMRDNEWTPAAMLRAGQRVRLSAVNWMDVAGEVDAVNRSEVEDEDAVFAEPFWGSLMEVSTDQ